MINENLYVCAICTENRVRPNNMLCSKCIRDYEIDVNNFPAWVQALIDIENHNRYLDRQSNEQEVTSTDDEANEELLSTENTIRLTYEDGLDDYSNPEDIVEMEELNEQLEKFIEDRIYNKYHKPERMEIVKLLMAGEDNNDIATTLGVHRNTVSNVKKMLYKILKEHQQIVQND